MSHWYLSERYVPLVTQTAHQSTTSLACVEVLGKQATDEVIDLGVI